MQQFPPFEILKLTIVLMSLFYYLCIILSKRTKRFKVYLLRKKG